MRSAKECIGAEHNNYTCRQNNVIYVSISCL